MNDPQDDHLSSFLYFINNHLDTSGLPDAQIGAGPDRLPPPIPRELGLASMNTIEESLRLRVDALLDQIFAQPGSVLHGKLTPHHLLILDQILKRANKATLWMPRTQEGYTLALIEMSWVVLGQIVEDGDVSDDNSTDR